MSQSAEGAVRIPVEKVDALAGWRERSALRARGVRLARVVRRAGYWGAWISIALGLGTLAAVIAVSGAAWAEVVPARGEKDPRVRTVAYDPDEVVRLQGFVGYQIHLQFAPGESFVNLAAGDTAGIDVGAEGSHLLLKPKHPSVATNLTILTTERVYTIAYSATRGAPDPARDEVIYSLRFRYPLEDAAAAMKVAAAEAAKQQAGKVVNAEYRTCGALSVRPSRVWDDGVHTHLAFRDQTEIPAVYVETPEGGESLVNFHVDATGLVVHRVAKKLVLRRGKLSACVENRAWVEPGSEGVAAEAVPSGKRGDRVRKVRS